jgi:quaternary ammonium compound-resistance protein SugE
VELLFVALFGALLGLVARYALPHRATHGVLLVPAVGTAAAMAAWVALTWAGLRWDQGVIWITTLGIAALVAVGVDLAVGRRRAAADARDLAAIGG